MITQSLSTANLLTSTGSPRDVSQIPSTSSSKIGQTWADTKLNIDLDNLMCSKSKQDGPAPTMNQLASNSPQHNFRSIGEL